MSVLNGTAWFVGEYGDQRMKRRGRRESDGGPVQSQSSNCRRVRERERLGEGESCACCRICAVVPTSTNSNTALAHPSALPVPALSSLSHPPWPIPRRARRRSQRQPRRALLPRLGPSRQVQPSTPARVNLRRTGLAHLRTAMPRPRTPAVRGQGRWVPPRPRYTCTSVYLLHGRECESAGRRNVLHIVIPRLSASAYRQRLVVAPPLHIGPLCLACACCLGLTHTLTLHWHVYPSRPAQPNPHNPC